MSEPIGWNVYAGQNMRFIEFLPNEPVLAREAEAFATRAGSFEVSGTMAVEFFPGAAEALLEMLRPRCGALLFPLPARVPRPVEPVHPLDAPYFAPVQGPQPAVCTLDEDHRIGWHWCDGTWWKA